MKKQFVSLLIILVGFCLSFPLGASTVLELKGEKVPTLLGQNIASFRMYAANADGKIEAIPFQVDEKYLDSSQGEWRFALDSEAKDSAENHKGNGLLKAQDVLVWMDQDAGPPVEAGRLPPAKQRVEIPSGTGDGRVAYLCMEENPQALSPKKYVQYQAQDDRVRTEFYSVAFLNHQPLIQDELILSPGANSPNILDRFKVRFKLAIKHFFDFSIDESEVEGKLVGYKLGPIRFIRRMAAAKSIGPIRVIPKVLTDFVFYEDWIEIPTVINNPLDGPKFLDENTQGLSGFDFNKNIVGATVYAEGLAQGIPLQNEIKKPDSTVSNPAHWWAISTSSGAMVVGIRNDKKLADLGIEANLRVYVNPQGAAPPEAEPGEYFVGFDLPYHKIPKGRYVLGVRQVFPKNFVHGREAFYLSEAKLKSAGPGKVLP